MKYFTTTNLVFCICLLLLSIVIVYMKQQSSNAVFQNRQYQYTTLVDLIIKPIFFCSIVILILCTPFLFLGL